MTEQTPAIVQHADDAYESIRAINHRGAPPTPAPVVYGVLGNLKTAGGYGLQQALSQLAIALEGSLETFDVYDQPGEDPAESVQAATESIRQAATLAGQIGVLLDAAQSAIASQGYRTKDESIKSDDLPQ